jgi:hypothetical protein
MFEKHPLTHERTTSARPPLADVGHIITNHGSGLFAKGGTFFVVGLILLLLPLTSFMDSGSGVTFHDIAAGGGAGISYHRVPSATEALFEALKQKNPFTLDDMVASPLKSRGAPGVAIFDYDRDGDLDIYVTNGPGAANSLYSNQLRQTGQVRFIDVARAAGVEATEQDSTGVCAGDIDNDGDQDLLVLGRSEPNRLFENQGDGTFRDITATSGLGGGNRSHMSASMGDVNGDGLLDVAVANGFDMSTQVAIFVEPFALNQHNQLFLNAGGNRFVDVSAASGIETLAGLPPEAAGAATITWAIAMVDYDLDGDVDILHADDQAAVNRSTRGGVDRGFIHILQNDGAGHFTDVSDAANMTQPDRAGGWMGLSFGDLNADGYMDIFSTNVGDYMVPDLGQPHTLGDFTSRWFLGQPGGRFADPGVGDLVATPFGWGTSMVDYDNDGDTDIIYYGGLDQGLIVEASNPGVILRNEGGAAIFAYDAAALAGSTNHSRRNVEGVAVGDLNNDGFVDIVSVSSFDSSAPIPLVQHSTLYGGPFDATALFVPTFRPLGPGQFLWNGFVHPDGTLSVEINSATNGNSWVEGRTVGTKGITSGGRVNRDGIGAVVLFTPDQGKSVMRPVVGGSSYASQDSLAATFGLGSAERGTIEVRWPGGVRNRLYDVRHGERIVLPEIPYSFDVPGLGAAEYEARVGRALDQLVEAGVLSQAERARLLASARRAFDESH